jgi:tRNA (cmo5U34)-methyltransferase
MSELAHADEKRDHVQPGDRWAFDGAVTDCFDDMLGRSIPQYEEMRRLCFDLGKRYVKPQSDIVDLGCSRGEALAPFVQQFGAFNRYVGVEVSPPMLSAARERFAGLIERNVVDIRSDDLREKYPPVSASLTLCVLTLQFTPIEHRLRIVRDAFKATLPGGAMILVEKILGATADLNTAMVTLYHDLKHRNGYTLDDIQRKRLSLEGVLVPVTERWNEEILRSSGFEQVDCFWRWMNFAGWIAVKT